MTKTRRVFLIAALLFTVACSLSAQVNGVTVNGGTITNSSSHGGIVCIVLDVVGHNSPLHQCFVDDAIPSDGQAHDLRGPAREGGILVAAVFDDGAFIGPDQEYTRAIKQWSAFSGVATEARRKKWTALEVTRRTRSEGLSPDEMNASFSHRAAAMALLAAKQLKGEEAALSLASKFMAISNGLRKEQQ